MCMTSRKIRFSEWEKNCLKFVTNKVNDFKEHLFLVENCLLSENMSLPGILFSH